MKTCNICNIKKKKKPTYAKQLEIIAKQYIHLRDTETCQRCGKQEKGLHVSHVIARRHGLLKWDEQNLKLLCYGCHICFWHKEPMEAMEWFKEKFPERYKYLQKKRIESMRLGKVGVDYFKEKIGVYKEKIGVYKEFNLDITI